MTIFQAYHYNETQQHTNLKSIFPVLLLFDIPLDDFQKCLMFWFGETGLPSTILFSSNNFISPMYLIGMSLMIMKTDTAILE